MAPITSSDLMHATLWWQPYNAEGRLFENKLDGFRALVRKTGGDVELHSHSSRSMADQFPDIIRAAQASPPASSSTRKSSFSTTAAPPFSSD